MRLALLVLLISGPTQEPPPADPDGAAFFESKIRPVLADRCYACHSAKAEKLKGGLLLDSREGLRKGGDRGAAIVPGDSEKSLLIKAIRYGDEDLQMPPKNRLSKEIVADFEAWVKRGAPDPRVGDAAARKDRPLPWSLHPVGNPPVPEVRHATWPVNPIDRFILGRLEEKGLEPAPPADRRTLLRRVTIDLTGLPPGEDDGAEYERIVDRLLASPRYGERWGRHWLDAVRYGESHGYERNHLRPNAWPYRDYVIRAFNADTPYPRFIAEQLAGDLVAPGDEAIEVATGFLVAGVHDDVGSPEESLTRMQRANDLDDMVATTSAVFLGLTLNCARCHDHKFDPIPQKDYYRMAAVFAGVRHEERPLEAVAARGTREKETAEVTRRIVELETQLAPQGRRPAVNTLRNVETFDPVRARFVRFTVFATKDGLEPCIDELEVYGPEGGTNLALAGKAAASSVYPNAAIHQVRHLNDGQYGNSHSWISAERGAGWAQVELAEPATVARVVWSRDSVDPPKFKDRLPLDYHLDVSEDGREWRTVACGADRATEAVKPAASPEIDRLKRRRAELAPRAAYIGKITAPDPVFVLGRGDVMKRGEPVTPGALSRVPGMAPEAATREALAAWIADPKNPLTARVQVNRVWQHHFGRGIVGTTGDFGANGEPPSHPELLDWLARDFMEHGWTLKRLHKMIVLSSTYRQSSLTNPKGEAIDAGDRLLWRMPLRRLEAEAARDAILAASGKLDLRMGGPGFALFKYSVSNIAFYEPLPEQGPETWRRAVYMQAPRAYRDDLMANFDAPETSLRAPRRESTTTALQAFTLLHAPFVVEQARFFADRAGGVDRAFRLALGRPPRGEERRAAEELLARRGLEALCRALLNSSEFLTY